MLLCQQTHKTHSYYHLVTAKPPFSRTTIDHMRQTRPSMLPSVTTHTSFTKSVMMSVTVSKLAVVSLSVLKWKFNGQYWWNILLSQQCYLLSNTLSTTILFAFQQHSSCMHQHMAHAAQFNSCCTELSTLFLLSYGPNRPELNQLITRFRESAAAWVWISSRH